MKEIVLTLKAEDLKRKLALKDGEPGPKGDKGDFVEGPPGKNGSPDSPSQIVTKLESLKDEARLDASAVKNLPELVERQLIPIGKRELAQQNDVSLVNPTNNQLLRFNSATNKWENSNPVDVAATWGGITGTLSNQTDLQTALDNKYDTSNPAGYISSTAGDWTGTFDGQQGTYYLARANHTGFQAISTVTDLQSTLDLKANTSSLALVATSGSYDDLLNKPTIPTQYTDEMAQDTVGGMVDSTLVYVDATPVLKRAPITGDISVPDGSNVAAIGAGVIVNADINASAAIDATKIADGSVTSTEFQYINTLSSNAQTQLDGKQPLDADLTSWAAITRASGFDTFVATPSSANLLALLTTKTGTGSAVFSISPTFTGTLAAENISTSGTSTFGDTTSDSHTFNGNMVMNTGAQPTEIHAATGNAIKLKFTATIAGVKSTQGWFGASATAIFESYNVAGVTRLSVTDTSVEMKPNNVTRFFLSTTGLAITGTHTSTGNMGAGTASPHSTLHTNGSFARAYRAITAARTLDDTDSVVNCTSGTFTVTLPTAAVITGREYVIKNSGTGVITVGTTSAQTIDGAASYSLSVQYQKVTVVSNGSNWIVTAT